MVPLGGNVAVPPILLNQSRKNRPPIRGAKSEGNPRQAGNQGCKKRKSKKKTGVLRFKTKTITTGFDVHFIIIYDNCLSCQTKYAISQTGVAVCELYTRGGGLCAGVIVIFQGSQRASWTI